jgi:hypothetical protein
VRYHCHDHRATRSDLLALIAGPSKLERDIAAWASQQVSASPAAGGVSGLGSYSTSPLRRRPGIVITTIPHHLAT